MKTPITHPLTPTQPPTLPRANRLPALEAAIAYTLHLITACESALREYRQRLEALQAERRLLSPGPADRLQSEQRIANMGQSLATRLDWKAPALPPPRRPEAR